MFVKSKKQKEIDQLRLDISFLKSSVERLEELTKIRVGEESLSTVFGVDKRPAISLNDLVLMLVDRMGLELQSTKPAKEQIILTETAEKQSIVAACKYVVR